LGVVRRLALALFDHMHIESNAILAELPCPSALDQPDLAQALQARLDQLTKPRGALGRLESLALHLGLILQTAAPRLVQPQLLVCAADHGLAAEGVSAYPSAVTAQMVLNFLRGGAAVSVLARQHGLALTVMDCGVAHDFEPHPQLRVAKTTHASANALHGPALTPAQRDAALRAGMQCVADLPGNVVLLGDMGIGNTSAAALLLARLGGHALAACVGRGTGLGDAGLRHKQAVLQAVLARHPPLPYDAATPQQALHALCAFGGAEIAALVGAVLQAASQRRVVVVDGFIVSAAVLVAACIHRPVLQACVWSHRSAEHGHAPMLDTLQAMSAGLCGVDVRPLLQLDLRLGEGSAAALAWPLLESSSRLLNDMATFDSAGVADRNSA
jgi:nicotinate-nucleotide--dimethylbenzimidazole phosphoribosyltransferase